MSLFLGKPDVPRLERKQKVGALIRALGYMKDDRVRADAARALGEIRDNRAVEPIIALLDDESRQARETAAWALGEIGDGRAVEPLLAAAKRGHREMARTALGALLRLGSVEALGVALRDEEWRVRKVAAACLGGLGEGRAVELLVGAMADSDESVREAAVEALGKAGGSRAAGALTAALGDGSANMRLAATRALAKMRTVEGLVLAFCQDDRQVRDEAAAALAEVPDLQTARVSRGAIDRLLGALKSRAATARREAAWLLGQLRQAQAMRPLIATLKDQDWAVRWYAARTLQQLHWEPDLSEAGATYWALIEDWDQCVNIGEAAVEPLVSLLADSAGKPIRPVGRRGWRRLPRASEIADALARIGHERAVGPLIAALGKLKRELGEDRWREAHLDNDSPGLRAWCDCCREREQQEHEIEALAAALERLTQQDFGDDAERWQQWWRQRQESLAISADGEARDKPQTSG